VNAADQALQTAWAWLNANAGSTCLYYDPSNPNGCGQGTGYNSSVPAIDPDWTQAANWTNAAVMNGGNPDAAGNTIYYFIHRMCTTPNSSTTANVCGSTPSNSAINTSGTDQTQANFFTQPPAIHYRITARAVGPRNSVTIVQTMLRTI
jgi:type IV pilus assembly protein PilX